MPNKFFYVVVKKLEDINYYMEIASTHDGLRALGWEPSKVDSQIFVIGSYDGHTYALEPNIKRDGFSAYSELRVGETIDELVNNIKSYRDWWLVKHNIYGNPRAIIESSYENQFKQIARQLRLSPKKIGDSFPSKTTD